MGSVSVLYAMFLAPTRHLAHENVVLHKHEGSINAKINWMNYEIMGAEISHKPQV